MAEKAAIPIYTSLEEIYPSKPAVLREGKRWNDLVETFEQRYGSRPSHIVRAPGRVNVLGEHVDYSLFSVLPAALEEDILIALRPRSRAHDPRSSQTAQINISNVDSRYPSSAFELTHCAVNGWDAGLKSAKGWGKYLRVALVECLEELLPGPEGAKTAVGMDLSVSGTVPPGSGLSSSAAFVVAGVLTFLVANGLTEGKTKEDVVKLAIASEHRMGLRTGGMDQSASVLCLPYNVLHLSFYPTLHPRPLPLPHNLAIVITNSLAPHALASSAPEHYNLRVIEVLCATRILLHAWGLDGKAGKKRVWLREVLGWKAETRGRNGRAEETEDEMEDDEGELLEAALRDIEVLKRDGGWTREDMIEASGMSKEEFEDTYLHFLEIRASHFHLYERIYHTLTESMRVHEFVQTCQTLSSNPTLTTNSGPHINGDSKTNGTAAETGLKKIGELLNASHECMKNVYGCTHPWVDELQEVCVKAGSIGSRMTGGGWGGSVVSLVPLVQVDGFLAQVREGYSQYRELSDKEFREAAFATLPGNGAGVYPMEDGGVQ